MRGRGLIAFCAVLPAVVLLPAAGASGATVDISGTWLGYLSSTAETNDVVISVHGTTVDISDTAAIGIHATDTDRCGHVGNLRHVVCDAAGLDTLSAFLGPGDDRLVFSGTWESVVCAGAGNDRVVGGAGSNLLVGGPGADLLLGGPSADVLSDRSGAECDSTGAAGGAGDRYEGGGGDDLLYSGPAGDELLGGPGEDTMIGRGGGDLLIGGEGPDGLLGVAGDDRLDGGAGPDVLSGRRGRRRRARRR